MKRIRKSILAVLLAVMVVMTYSVPAFAEDSAEADKAAEETTVQTEKETKPAKPEVKETEPPAPTETEAPAAEPEESGQQAETQARNDKSEGTSKKVKNQKNQKKKGDANENGTYKPDKFDFGGGTGKAKLTCDKVVRKNGKTYAFLRASSDNMTHIYMGEVSSSNEDPSLYDPKTATSGKDVYPINDHVTVVPTDVNKEVKCAARSTAMSEPHWINYHYTITLTDSAEKISDSTDLPANVEPEEPAVPEDTGDQGGSDQGDQNTSTDSGSQGGTPDQGGQNTPTDPGTPGTSTDPNAPTNPDGSTDPSSTDPTDPAATDPTDPAAEENPTDPAAPGNVDPTDPGQTDTEEPLETQKLGTGTWKVKGTTCRVMFYLYPKEKDPAWTILKVKKNGTMTATITLTGDGYDYVYMGTPAQAKRAGKKNWIKAKVKNGYYSFNVPVSALDKRLNITPHSKKYEEDGDVTTEPWRPDKWIMFYSGGAKKVKDGTTISTGSRSGDSGSSSGNQTKFNNDNKADKESKWKDDSGKSTSAVNNSTSLKDGVYTPDRFSWSGGSGRLAYIRCNKITVKGGKAYATIEFSSSKYDSLKANGRVYSKQGGGNSKFVIPVKLNANNTIIGRTTAMSQPHWIKYTIFIYKAGATAGKGSGSGAGTDGHVTNTKELTKEAPDLLGLKAEGAVDVKYATKFKIFKYEKGITLIALDQASGTALQKKENAEDQKDAKGADDQKDEQNSGEETGSAGTMPSDVLVNADGTALVTSEALAKADGSASAMIARTVSRSGGSETIQTVADADAVNASAEETAEAEASQNDGAQSTGEAKVEYDEEGKPIAKTENEVTAELYENNVVNYLIVPKGTELPAGLEKDCIIIEQPVDKSFVASEDMLTEMDLMKQTGAIDSIGMKESEVSSEAVKKALKKGDITAMDSYEKPDYKHMIKAGTDLAVLPEAVLPEKVTKDSTAEQEELSKQKTAKLRTLQSRFATLGIPVMINRASDEKDSYARAEWIKVCGAIFGEEKQADQLFQEYVKENKKEKIND